MKYTIHGLQQKKLIELGLTNDDALILSVIKDMYSSASIESRIIDNEKYVWVNQNSLIFEQIPILGTKRTLLRKIKKFEELNILKRKIVFDKNGIKGTYSYITITSKLDWLSEYEIIDLNDKGYDKMSQGYDNFSQGVCQNVTRGMTKCHSKDYSIKDYSIKDYIDRVIKTWNSLNLNKLVSIQNKRLDFLKARIKDYGIDEILKAIESINNSKFLKGDNDRNWKITFDWFIKPGNFVKVLEGNYLSNNKEEKTNGNEYNFKFD